MRSKFPSKIIFHLILQIKNEEKILKIIKNEFKPIPTYTFALNILNSIIIMYQCKYLYLVISLLQ